MEKKVIKYIILNKAIIPTALINKEKLSLQKKGTEFQDYLPLVWAKHKQAQETGKPISYKQAFQKSQFQTVMNYNTILYTNNWTSHAKDLIMASMTHGKYTRLIIPELKLEFKIRPLKIIYETVS